MEPFGLIRRLFHKFNIRILPTCVSADCGELKCAVLVSSGPLKMLLDSPVMTNISSLSSTLTR